MDRPTNRHRWAKRMLAAAFFFVPPVVGAQAPSSSLETIASQAAPPIDEPRGRLDLAAALRAARLHNPLLRAGQHRADARAAEIAQAGLLPNPNLEVELENIGGSGSREGVEQAETTVWLSQQVPIGGKRDRRREIADLRHELALWDNAARRTTLLGRATKAFVAVLAAQERVALAVELEDVAERGVEVLTNLARAGAAPVAARAKAEVALLAVRLERARAQRELAGSRLDLAATWGSSNPQFDGADGDLRDGVVDPPPLENLVRDVAANPDVAGRATAVVQREANLSLARALRLPDPTLRVAGRHFSSGDDAALVLAVSLPIPIFDRNQGNAIAAAEQVAQARAEHAATELAVHNALARRHQDLTSAFEQLRMLRDSAIPAARDAFGGAGDAFRAGVLSYLDVLDAQRTLFDLRAREVDALSAYHEARADIAQLLGQNFADEEPLP